MLPPGFPGFGITSQDGRHRGDTLDAAPIDIHDIDHAARCEPDAGLLVTTEAMIADKLNKEEAPGHPARAGVDF